MYMYVRHVITRRKPIAACAEIAIFLAICEEIAFFTLSKHGQNSAWAWPFRTWHVPKNDFQLPRTFVFFGPKRGGRLLN